MLTTTAITKYWDEHINDDTIPFPHRLVAYAASVTLISATSLVSLLCIGNFDGGQMHVLSTAASWIAEDQALHVDFACLIQSYLRCPAPQLVVYSLIKEAMMVEMSLLRGTSPDVTQSTITDMYPQLRCQYRSWNSTKTGSSIS